MLSTIRLTKKGLVPREAAAQAGVELNPWWDVEPWAFNRCEPVGRWRRALVEGSSGGRETSWQETEAGSGCADGVLEALVGSPRERACRPRPDDVAGAAPGSGLGRDADISWRASRTVDGADEVERPLEAVGTAPGGPVLGGQQGGRLGHGRRGGALMLLEDRAGRGEHRAAGGCEEAVVAHLGEAAREHVLQEAGDELGRRELAATGLVGVRVGVPEDHASVVEQLDAVLGDRDPVDVAGKVAGDADAVAGVLHVDHPGRGPDLSGDLLGEPGEGATDSGAKQLGQRVAGDQEAGVSGTAPDLAVDTAGGHQDVDVGVEEHRPSPCVEHGHHAEARAEVTRVVGQKLEAGGGLVDQHVVEPALMGSREPAQRTGKREGHQVVRARQQLADKRGEPAAGAVRVACRAVAVAAGVRCGVDAPAAVAAVLAGAERGRAAGGEVGQRAAVGRQHAVAECGEVRRTCSAEDRAEGGHSSATAEAVDWVAGGAVELAGQVRVALSGADTGVAEVVLDQPQADAELEQVGGVAVAQGVDVGVLDDAGPPAGGRRRTAGWSG